MSNDRQHTQRIAIAILVGVVLMTALGSTASAADTTDPVIGAVSAPRLDDGYINAAEASSVTVTFDATDNESGVAWGEATLAGVSQAETLPAPQTPSYSFAFGIDVHSEPDGAVTLSVSAEDADGNRATDSTSYASIHKDTEDPTATVSGAPASPSCDENPSFAFTAEDPEEDGYASGVVAVEAQLTGEATRPWTSSASSGGTWSASVSELFGAGLATDGSEDGEITLEVRAVDEAGNVSATDSVSWTYDSQPPTLDLVTIDSSNGSHPDAAKVGDAVILSFTSSEPLGSVQVSIGGSAAPLGGGPTIWSATEELGIGTAEGVLAFQISFSDVAGNPGAPVTATTDGSAVTFDKTAPTISGVTAAAVADTYLNAAEAAGFAVSFTASDSGSGVCHGRANVQETASNPDVYGYDEDEVTPPASSHSFTFGDLSALTADDGQLELLIEARDAAGNLGATVHKTFHLDTGAPTSTISDGPADPDNAANPQFTYAVSDPEVDGYASGIASAACRLLRGTSVEVEWSSCAPGGGSAGLEALTGTKLREDGDYTLEIRATDVAENIGPTASHSWTYDTAAPSVADDDIVVTSGNPTDWSVAGPGDTLTVTFTASEPLASAELTVGSHVETATAAGTVWSAAIVLDGSDTEGPIGIAFEVVDLAGNPGSKLHTSSVAFDKSAPTVSGSTCAAMSDGHLNAAEAAAIVASFTASDSGSGISSGTATLRDTSTSIEASAQATGSPASYSFSLSFNAADARNGAVWLDLRAEDVAGNLSPTVTLTANLDTAAPGASVDAGPATPSDEADLTFTVGAADPAVDGYASGVGQIQVRLTGTATTGWNTWPWAGAPLSKPLSGFLGGTTLAADGEYSFEARAVDAAGNTGAVSSYTWSYNAEVPVLNSVSAQSDNTHRSEVAKSGDTVTVSFTASEPLATPTVTIAGEAAAVSGSEAVWSASVTTDASTPEGEITFEIRFSDSCGAAGVPVIVTTDGSTVSFDATVPTIVDLEIPELDDGYLDALEGVGGYAVLLEASDAGVGVWRPTSSLPTDPAIAPCSPRPSHTFLLALNAAYVDDGAFSVTLGVEDAAGNSRSLIRTGYKDSQAPSVIIGSGPGSPSSLTDPAFSFDATDPDKNGYHSGVASLEARLIGATATGWHAIGTSSGSYARTLSQLVGGTLPTDGSADGEVILEIRATDAAGNAATTTHVWTFDSRAPSVRSIVRLDADPTGLQEVQFEVTYSEAVTGADDPAAYALTTTGAIAGAAVVTISGGGDSYVVTVDTGSGDGTLRLDVPAGGPIADLAGRPLDGGFSSGAVYTISKGEPSLSFVSIGRRDGHPYLNTDASNLFASTVRLRFTCSQPLGEDPVVSILGHSVIPTTSDGMSFEAELPLGPSDEIGDGSISFAVTLTSPTGTSFGPFTTTTDGSYAIVDGRAPLEAQGTFPEDGAFTNDTTPTLGCAGALDVGGSGIGLYRFDIVGPDGPLSYPGMARDPETSYTWPTPLPEGLYTWSLTPVDRALNEGPPIVSTLVIDTTPPAVRIDSPADRSVYDLEEPVVATWAVEDTSPVTVESTSPLGEPVDTVNPGRHQFIVRATDAAGNETRTLVSYLVRFEIEGIGEITGAEYLDRAIPTDEQILVGSLPRVAVYEVGEPITGACVLLDGDGNPVEGSRIALTLYAVTIDGEEETRTPLDAELVRYDHDSETVPFSIDTVELPPGVYDLRLGFADRTVIWLRVEIVEPDPQEGGTP